MRSEIEVYRELQESKRIFKERGDMMLYGAINALAWVLEKTKSPSEIDKICMKIVDGWHGHP